jgi:hypothetical protein
VPRQLRRSATKAGTAGGAARRGARGQPPQAARRAQSPPASQGWCRIARWSGPRRGGPAHQRRRRAWRRNGAVTAVINENTWRRRSDRGVGARPFDHRFRMLRGPRVELAALVLSAPLTAPTPYLRHAYLRPLPVSTQGAPSWGGRGRAPRRGQGQVGREGRRSSPRRWTALLVARSRDAGGLPPRVLGSAGW